MKISKKELEHFVNYIYERENENIKDTYRICDEYLRLDRATLREIRKILEIEEDTLQNCSKLLKDIATYENKAEDLKSCLHYEIQTILEEETGLEFDFENCFDNVMTFSHCGNAFGSIELSLLEHNLKVYNIEFSEGMEKTVEVIKEIFKGE